MWARGRWSLPAGPSGSGQVLDSLLVALAGGGGLGLQVGLGLLQPGQPPSPAGQRPWQFGTAGGAVLAVFRLVGGRCLGEQLGDLGLEVGVGAVGGRGGGGGDLGPVQGDQPRRTRPAAAHSLSEATSSPARACSWRTRNRAMVT